MLAVLTTRNKLLLPIIAGPCTTIAKLVVGSLKRWRRLFSTSVLPVTTLSVCQFS